MERIYVVPVRKVKKVPSTKRAQNAVRYLRSFIAKNMKSQKVKLNSALNERLWQRGIANIPERVKVKATKQEDGTVLVALAEP